MKTYFVTGCLGFVGYHLCKTLTTKGNIVYGFDKGGSSPVVTMRLEELSKLKRFQFYIIDLVFQSQVEGLRKKLGNGIKRPDILFHLAGIAGVRSSPLGMVDSNLVAFTNLLDFCRMERIPLVYASSSSVYGDGNTPMRETQPPQPKSLYASTKLCCEYLAQEYQKEFGVSSVGIRPFTLYGPFGRPNMAYYLFTKALHEQLPINLYGNTSRDFTYIDDAVKALILVSQKLTAEPSVFVSHPVVNVCTGSSHTMEELLQQLKKCMASKTGVEEIEINRCPMNPSDVTKTQGSFELIHDLVRWKPTVSFDQGIAKFVDWYLESCK